MSLSCTSWQACSLVTLLLLLLLLCLHFSMSTCLLFSALSKDHTSMRTRSQKKKLGLILQALEILWCTSDADVKRSFFWEMYHLQKLHRLCTHASQCINVLLVKPSLCIHAQSYKNMKVVTEVQTESSPSSVSKLLIHRRV